MELLSAVLFLFCLLLANCARRRRYHILLRQGWQLSLVVVKEATETTVGNVTTFVNYTLVLIFLKWVNLRKCEENEWLRIDDCFNQ